MQDKCTRKDSSPQPVPIRPRYLKQIDIVGAYGSGVRSSDRATGVAAHEASKLAGEEAPPLAEEAADRARSQSPEQLIEANRRLIAELERLKLEQQALRESEQRYRETFECAAVAIAHVSLEGQWLQVNQTMCEITGYSHDELLSLRFQDITHLDDLPADLEQLQRLLDSEKNTYSMQKRYIRKDGQPTWVQLTVSLVRRPPVEPDYFVAVVERIDDRKLAEQSLRESDERLRSAARLARFGTYFFDCQSRRIEWSSEVKEMVGLALDGQIASADGHVPDFIAPDDRRRIRKKFADSLDPNGNGRFQDECRIDTPRGEVIWLLIQGRTLFEDERGERRAVRNAGIVMDITQRRKFEEELQEARAAAERASKAKSQFLANVSHEIRTPMTAILGYADVLGDRLQDRDDLNCIATIKQNGEYLCEILNDILDLSKIEAGKIKLRREPTTVLALLADVRSLMAIRADEKQLSFGIEFVGEIPQRVITDAKAVRQVLINLVGNAIKFTTEGYVRVVVKCDAARELLQVSVVDSGMGISEYEKHRLFEPFEQADDSSRREIGGTGLGLTISSKLATLLGGEVSLVESTPRQGSTFRFTLSTGPLNYAVWMTPRESDLRGTDSTDEAPPQIAGHILAVDDRREVRYLVKNFVEAAGGEVVTADDGAEAVQIWLAHRADGRVIDAILMDMHMPRMDGLEATRLLREDGYRGPIIALTASTMAGDREKCLKVGCDDFLCKPIKKAELYRKLLHAMKSRRG